jgi:hypothetical protein
MLFAHLPTPAMAGNMAAHLFTLQTWVSVACAGLLLLLSRGSSDQDEEPCDEHLTRLRAVRLPVLGGMIVALLVEFAVSPHIVARDNLALWHSVGSALYLVQGLCALWTFGRLIRSQR